MHLPWILVVAVWCVFGRTESASIQGANRSHDAHMIGGEPVDPNIIQPVIATLIVKDEDAEEIIRTCDAFLLKRTSNSYSHH